MTEWNDNINKAPEDIAIIVKVDQGLFSGGMQWHKAIRVGNKFFNYETHNIIYDPNSWLSVEL